MSSVILRVRQLSVLAEQLLQYEKLGSHCTLLRRSLLTKNVLLSVDKKVFNAPNIKNYVLASSTEKNLGKIVDLEVDFDDVKVEGENKRGRRKKTMRVNKQMKAKSQEREEGQEECPEESNELEDSGVTQTKKSKQNLKDNDLLFNSLMTELKSKKLKEKNKKIILEGKRLIYDAITAGFMPEMIFYSRKSDVEKVKVPDEVKLFRISYNCFKLWTDVVTPQGFVGVFQMPDLTAYKNTNPMPLTIICDNIREPGNLGTIIRIAAGVGCRKLILSKGCVNIWEPKVLRAGAGAHFHLAIFRNMQWSDIESDISEDSKVFLADLKYETTEHTADAENQSSFSVKYENSESLPLHCYSSVEYTNEETVIVIGGETYGLCNEAYTFAEKRKGARVFIPMSNGVESLNNSVALGILAYEIRRQLDSLTQLPVTEDAVAVNKS